MASEAASVAALELRGVGKLIGPAWAVRGVTLTVAAGELFVLVGGPRAGKTTLLDLILGFLDPDLGEIAIDGQSVAGVAARRRQLGLVPANLGLWPNLSAFEHAAFGLREARLPAGDVRTRVADALRVVGLDGMERRLPADLTPEQGARLALARALAPQPRVLLLDDPFSTLGPGARRALRRDLRRIHRDTRLTMIHATRDADEATALATRLGVIDRGELIQTGPPAEVYRRPLTRAVAELLGDLTVLAGRLEDGPSGLIVRIKDGLTLTVTSDLASGGAVTCLIRPEAIQRAAPDVRDPNRVFATVASVGWMRGRWECELALAGGVTLRADLSATGFAAPVVGDLVTVLIPSDDIVVLPG